MSNSIIGSSAFLLRLVGTVGIEMAISAMLYAAYSVFRVLALGVTPPPGWTVVIVLMTVLNGLVLLTMSIIGECFVRLLHNTAAKPIYVIRQVQRTG